VSTDVTPNSGVLRVGQARPGMRGPFLFLHVSLLDNRSSVPALLAFLGGEFDGGVGLPRCLRVLVLDCSSYVGKKFLDHAEPQVARHRYAEAYSPIAQRTLTGGLPSSG